MKSVAVYCGSAHGNSPEFTDAARALGTELARRGLNLVYGGGKVGLMGEVANAVLEAGGTVTGVIPHHLADLELGHPGLTELEFVDTMAQRKTRMEQLADAFVALPGGVGTLEELTEVMTLQQLGHLAGPIGLLNTAGFWDPFVEMYHSIINHGFIQPRYADAIILNADPAALLDAFADWAPLPSKWS